MKRRATKIGILGAAVCALLVWMGCAGALTGKRGATGSACRRDTDCPVGFCDRGACVALSGTSNLGAACDSVPPARTPAPGQPDPVCGGLLCVEGRCRSCRTDTECESYFGAGTCDGSERSEGLGGSLMRGCRLTADSFRYRDVESNSDLACANVGPDVPVEQRLVAGKSCARDCDCRSGFCDRGACADTVHMGRGASSLGGWCLPHRPVSSEYLDEVIPSQPRRAERCRGYVCIDERCRSCISDAECHVGASEYSREYKCLPRVGEPGKRCGRPNEKPKAPSTMPTQEELEEIERDLQEFRHLAEPP
jgi:hypothetical protein